MDSRDILLLSLAIFAFVWIVQGIAAGYIAKRRGRTLGIWMLVALLLFVPIGFIATLIYTKDDI